jgi:hypothetical protein
MIVIDKDIMVPMTDGVRLATDVFRLQDVPSPVLLVRTPYSKDQMTIGGSDSYLGGTQWLRWRLGRNRGAGPSSSPTASSAPATGTHPARLN